jgi:PKD repeat protein
MLHVCKCLKSNALQVSNSAIGNLPTTSREVRIVKGIINGMRIHACFKNGRNMDFNLLTRSNKIAYLFLLAMLTCLYENALAQSVPCVAETTFLVNIQPKPTPVFSFMASGFSATFSNASINSTSYSWDFGDPGSGASNTSSIANPTHNFSSPGNYTVTLTAVNSCGSRTITQTVQLSCPTLSVPVSANGPTVVCSGQTAMLSAASGYQGYQWQLNGNPVAGGTNATLQASQSGQYTVVATNAQGCTGQSQSISVEVLPLAQPSFTTTSNSLNFSFVNTSAHSTSYAWNFGDPNSGASNTSSEQNPTHQFTAAGSFTVSLTATNSCGSQTITQIVQPGCPPVSVTAFATGPTEICPGASVQLTAPMGFNSYQWLLGGNPITNANAANFVANQPGAYTVQVTDAGGCIGTSQGISVVLLPLAQPAFSSTVSALSASFTNNSSNSTSYAWNFGDPNSGASNTSSELNPTHQFSAPGTYTVILTATNTCGSQTITQTVVIGCTPPQVSISSVGPIQFCEGGSATLQAAPTNFSAYHWYLNNAPIPAAIGASISATVAGQYKVLVTDAFGCENYSTVLDVVVHPLPTATITSSMGAAVCAGNSLVLSGGLGPSYQWTAPNGSTAFEQNVAIPSANLSNNGTYRLRVTDGNGCTSTTEFNLTVHPIPNVSLSGLNSNYMESDSAAPVIGTPVGGIFSGAGVAGNQFDPSAAGLGQHTIFYTYTDANNCSNTDSVIVNVTPTVSTSSLTAFVSQIKVFPNPNQGDFWLEIELSAQRTLHLSLVNALGQTLVNRLERLPTGRSTLHFSSHELSSGVYFLKVLDGEQYACLRVIVAH